MKKNTSRYPARIAIIGGGRWARVLIEVLCSLVPSTVELSIHTPNNAKFMRTWLEGLGWEGKIWVSEELPQFMPVSSAVIVANAARDHEKGIEWALSRGIPVLVEKPIALNSRSAHRLAEMAERTQTRFASAHVFLFASYLEKFANIVKDSGEVRSIKIIWSDPTSEKRYGEHKQYDPGLAVFADCFPHILSILSCLFLKLPTRCNKLKFFKGGSHIELELSLGDILCQVQLVRNGEIRQRIVEVMTSQEVIKLDFSTEPGTIFFGATATSGDLNWALGPRPVARLLMAFCEWAAGGADNHRLNIEIGLRANQIIDQVVTLYDSARVPWLIEKLGLSNAPDSELRYALTELLLAEGLQGSGSIEEQIEKVWQEFSGANASRLIGLLNETENPERIFKSIVAVA